MALLLRKKPCGSFIDWLIRWAGILTGVAPSGERCIDKEWRKPRDKTYELLCITEDAGVFQIKPSLATQTAFCPICMTTQAQRDAL